jgi:hypothetical protein
MELREFMAHVDSWSSTQAATKALGKHPLRDGEELFKEGSF